MDDLVLREVTILIRDCSRMAKTLTELRRALRNDPRFVKVISPNEEDERQEVFEGINRTGPEDLPIDPFTQPFGRSHD
jgi:hypothetical protein